MNKRRLFDKSLLHGYIITEVFRFHLYNCFHPTFDLPSRDGDSLLLNPKQLQELKEHAYFR